MNIGEYQAVIERAPLACAFALVLACMITDVYQRRIPNCLTIPAVAAGLGFALLGNGWDGVWLSVVGIAVGFGLLFLPFYFGGMGAGDVKLMAALGALLGASAIIQVFLYSAIVGGVLAVVSVVRERACRETAANIAAICLGWWSRLGSGHGLGDRPHRSVGNIPYGVAIGLGTIAYYYFGALV